MRQSEERGKGDSVPLYPKGSSSSSSMAGKVRYTAGRRGTRNEDVQSGRGSSSMAGRVEYMAGWKWKTEDIPSSSADSESASCTSSSMAEGLVIRREKRGWRARTHCRTRKLFVERLVGWLRLFLCWFLGDVVVEELPGNGWQINESFIPFLCLPL